MVAKGVYYISNLDIEFITVELHQNHVAHFEREVLADVLYQLLEINSCRSQRSACFNFTIIFDTYGRVVDGVVTVDGDEISLEQCSVEAVG